MSWPRVTTAVVDHCGKVDPGLRVWRNGLVTGVEIGPVLLQFDGLDEVEGWARLLLRQCADARREREVK